jgi:hypothetical protein
MENLTWNQRRALENLIRSGGEATAVQITDKPTGKYLCGSAARSALRAVVRKGCAEKIGSCPLTYRVTEKGRASLEEQQP